MPRSEHSSLVPIILEIKAEITRRQPTPRNQNRIDLQVHGKAYPYISSGSIFGCGSTHETVEEAKNELQSFLKIQKQWFKESYHRRIYIKLETSNHVKLLQTQLF